MFTLNPGESQRSSEGVRMEYTLWQWIGDEAVLQEFTAGLSTSTLLLIIVVCIVLLSKGAD